MAGYVVDLGGAQEGLHTGGDGADLVEYLFRGGRPCDGRTVAVPVLDERLPAPDELRLVVPEEQAS